MSQEKIDALQKQMNTFHTELKLINANLKQIGEAIVETKDLRTKVHELELTLVANSTKLGSGERFIWIVVAAGVGIVASLLK